MKYVTSWRGQAVVAILLSALAAAPLACGSEDEDPAAETSASGGAGGATTSSGTGGEVIPEGEIPPSPGDAPDCSADVIQATAPADALPDYGSAPTLTAVKAGAWSDPAVWSEGRTPTDGDVVVISGAAVTYDEARDDELTAVVIKQDGVLIFGTQVATRLVVATMQVQRGGELRVGGLDGLVQQSVTAEIVIADQPIDTVFDPEQFGHGLVVEGKVTMHGAVKTGFVRLSAQALAGTTTLSLSQPVIGWQAGDRIGLPDTRFLSPDGERFGDFQQQSEAAVVSNVSADGLTVTLSTPLSFDHRAALDVDGQPEFFPHAANLARNVVIRSMSPTGVRGHTLLHHRADADIRYVQFQDLGRTTDQDFDSTTFDDMTGDVTHVGTNQRGRYPLHASQLVGPADLPADGYQFKLAGNAFVDSARWPISIDGAHFGLVFRNVVYGATGAGIVGEAGNESFNLLQENFVLAITGHRTPRDNDARAGEAFYFNGFNNHVRMNTGAGCACTVQEIVCGNGYKLQTAAAGSMLTIPTCRGVDTEADGVSQGVTDVDSRFQPILEFSDNEAYGAMAAGMTIWNLNSDGYGQTSAAPPSIVKNLRVWHAWEEGFFGYPIEGVIFDGFVVRGDPALVDHPFAGSAGWSSGDYWAENVTIKNADIQGVKDGFSSSTNTPGTIAIEDSFFRTRNVGVSITTLATPGTKADMPARQTRIKNCRFEAWPSSDSASFMAVETYYTLDRGHSDVIQLDEIFVEDFNGAAGDDFQIYYVEQAPDFIVPETAYDPDFPTVLMVQGSPQAGLTNQQNWDTFGIAIAGAVSPTSTTRAGIAGFVRAY